MFFKIFQKDFFFTELQALSKEFKDLATCKFEFVPSPRVLYFDTVQT